MIAFWLLSALAAKENQGESSSDSLPNRCDQLVLEVAGLHEPLSLSTCLIAQPNRLKFRAQIGRMDICQQAEQSLRAAPLEKAFHLVWPRQYCCFGR